MKKTIIVVMLLVLCAGCGLSPEEIIEQTAIASTTTAAAWTATPTTTPTATPTTPPTATSTATQTPTPTATPEPLIATAAAESKLHTGPDAAYPVVGKAAKGDPLEVLARNQDDTWLEIKTTGGETAWVPVKNLKLANDVTGTLPTITEFSPPPPPIRGWRGNPVQTVCLVMEGSYTGLYHQQYPDAKFEAGDPNFYPILEDVKGYISQLGLNVVSPDDPCDATIAIKLTINIKGATYKGESSGTIFTCYDGASVNGTVSLASKEAKLSFTNSKTRPGEFPDILSFCPMASRFNGEAEFIVLQAMRQMWGDRVLVFGVWANQTDVAQYALKEMTNLGTRGKQYVPELIKCLKDDCQPFNTEDIVKALKSLTGQDFGEDADAWQEWAESQKF